MARHITTAITLLVLCGLLVLGAITGWRYLFAELPDSDKAAEEPAATCTTKQVDAGQRLRTTQVRVSVFNGGSRSGLAADTLAALKKRGFKAGDTGNAPDDVTVKRVIVWSMEENDAEARLVAAQFGKKTKVVFSDVDLGPGVDVIVGNAFRSLKRKAPTAIKINRPEEVCVQPKSVPPSPDADTNASG